MSLITTPAILLRSFPYSESSTILKFYTAAHGVTGVMARGVRSRQSRGGQSMGTFSAGTLTLYFKQSRELQTMKEFTVSNPRLAISSDVSRFAAASVLAEMVLRHAGAESNPDLFARLDRGLDHLGTTERTAVVATFLAEMWGVVDALGYRPELESCVVCGRPLEAGEMGRFDYSAGGMRCTDCATGSSGPRIGPGARAQLATLLEGHVPRDLNRARAHTKLLRDFVTYHVSDGRPLQSFAVLFDLLSPVDA